MDHLKKEYQQAIINEEQFYNQPIEASITNLEISINEKLKIIQKKIYYNIARKCKKEYSWLKRNGTIDANFNYQLENYMAKDEAPSRVKELQECFYKNEFDFTNLLNKIEKGKKKNKGDLNKCLNNCQTQTSPEECSHLCLQKMFNEIKQTDKDIDSKNEEVDNTVGNKKFRWKFGV